MNVFDVVTGALVLAGSVLALTGFGRGDRVISQALAMDVITHQKGLDFTPGAEYSYSNSGYQLAATIVERVSKQSFPAFTEEPLMLVSESEERQMGLQAYQQVHDLHRVSRHTQGAPYGATQDPWSTRTRSRLSRR